MIDHTMQNMSKTLDFQIKASELLSEGKVVLLPTDTIWGICCDATNEAAVKKVFDIKKRPLDKPFVLLADSIEMVEDYVKHIHPKINTLLEYNKRPLTVIYPHAINLPSVAYGKNGSVGIRIVQDDFCKNIIALLGKPIVATSANISDAPFPKNFGEISSDVLQAVDYVVPHRQMEKEQTLPSVIIRLTDKEEIEFLRE